MLPCCGREIGGTVGAGAAVGCAGLGTVTASVAGARVGAGATGAAVGFAVGKGAGVPVGKGRTGALGTGDGVAVGERGTGACCSRNIFRMSDSPDKDLSGRATGGSE